MKLNKKGFTLIEVIITIGLFILIASIAIPSVINIQNKKDRKQCEELKDLMLEKAIVYARLNDDFDYTSNNTIRLETLINEHLFDPNTKNNIFNTKFPSTTQITISKSVDNEISASTSPDIACD